MEQIDSIERFNEDIEKCETWGDAVTFFEKVSLDLLKNFIDVSTAAQAFKLLTMRGDFMLNQSKCEYEKRMALQTDYI